MRKADLIARLAEHGWVLKTTCYGIPLSNPNEFFNQDVKGFKLWYLDSEIEHGEPVLVKSDGTQSIRINNLMVFYNGNIIGERFDGRQITFTLK